MPTDTLFIAAAQEPGISNIMLFVNAFSGAGAALAIFLLTQIVRKVVESRKSKRRRTELLQLILDETSSNCGRLSEMIADPHFRPYWHLSTQSFYNVSKELSAIIGKSNELLHLLYSRYRVYDMINRQLDLLHFRDEGIQATIYLDSTLPLAKNEYAKICHLEESLLQELKMDGQTRTTKEIGHERKTTYADLMVLYRKTLEEVEDYWAMLSSIGKGLYDNMLEQLECDSSVLRVAHINDPEGFKSAQFFDTLHFRNLSDGTYRFRIQLKINISNEPGFFVSIPIALWLRDRCINLRIRNGEYIFSYPAGGEYDLSETSKALISIIRKALEGNLKDIKPEKQDS